MFKAKWTVKGHLLSLQIGFTFSVPVAKTTELSGSSSVSEPITSSSGKKLLLIVFYIKIG